MAQKYAKGTRAWGICGRGGHRVLLKDMVFDGRYPNMRVDPAWYEDKHPQEFLPKVEDPIALYRPAVEVITGPTAPVLAVILTGTQASLTWSPSETDISEIDSYTIMRSIDGAPAVALIVCAVLRDFLGGIIGVQHCTTVPSIPRDDSGDSGSVYDKVTNEDAPITYVDTTLSSGHTYCYTVFSTPMGNNQSVAQGPPSANSNTVCVTSGGAAGLIWQHRANFGAPVVAVAANAGIALAIDGGLVVHRSIDGGRTWAVLATIDPTLIGAGGNLIFNNGAWIFAAGGSIARSTDNGATWTRIDTGATSAGFGVVAGNGGNVLVLSTNTFAPSFPQVNYARSTDNGLTWTASDVLVGATLYPTPPVWDGTQFVAILQAPITFLTYVATSPDALTWTTHPVSVAFPNGLAGLQLSAGVYTSSTLTTVDCIVTGTTPANLATGTAVPVSADNNGLNAILVAAGLYFAFDGVGGVYNSTDAVNWFVGTLNLTGGDVVNGLTCAAYDAVNSSYIAAGAAGNVSTYPPGGGGPAAWVPEVSGLTVVQLDSIASGHSTIIALAGAFDGGITVSNDNGLTWTPNTAIATNRTLFDIAFGNGVFLTGATDTISPGVLRSTDFGATWTLIPVSAPTAGWAAQSLAYGNGVWVAMGGTVGTGNYAISLDDGLTWTLPGLYSSSSWPTKSLIWTGTQFFGLGSQSGTGFRTIVTSPDGRNWTETVITASIKLGTLAAGNGKYMLALSGETSVLIADTPAGLAVATPTPVVFDPLLGDGGVTCVFIQQGGFFLAFGDSGGVSSSTDGVTWTASVLNFQPPGVGNTAVACAFGTARYVAAGSGANISIYPGP